MRESDIAAAVARWLSESGHEVHGEVQVEKDGSRFDVVGLLDGEPSIVETKVAYSRDVRFQAARAMRVGRWVWVATASRPRLAPPPEPDLGWGILRVVGDRVETIRPARPAPTVGPDAPNCGALVAACGPWTLGRVGGVQHGAGQTPSPYRRLVWSLATAMRDREPMQLGEVLDVFRALPARPRYACPRARIRLLLEREPAFARLDDGWIATGLGMPGDKPRRPNLARLAGGPSWER